MTQEEIELENKKINQENFRNLHSLQYDRIGKLENQENYISSFVTGLSTITIIFSFTEKSLDPKLKYVILPLIFCLANFVAILYIQKTRKFIKIHQKRAKKMREKFSPDVQEQYDEVNKPNSDKDWFNRTNYMSILHFIIGIIAIFILCYYKTCS